MSIEEDLALRLAAFASWSGGRPARATLPFALLREGFEWGQRIHLMNQQGIFKPRDCRLPLSMATAPRKPGKAPPYNDAILDDGLLRYNYRNGPAHPTTPG